MGSPPADATRGVGRASVSDCGSLVESYASEEIFRNRIVMARYSFRSGAYKYFDYPFPRLVAGLRAALYPGLSAIASRWNETMGIGERFPEKHAEYLDRCHRAGLTRSTPLRLQDGEGDYNCLYQDKYGEHVFPLQAVFLLSDPNRDFGG